MIGRATMGCVQTDRDDEARAEALARIEERRAEIEALEAEIDEIKAEWFAAHHCDLEEE